jgi:drug/metabolite transporter (DMT)-like permease
MTSASTEHSLSAPLPRPVTKLRAYLVLGLGIFAISFNGIFVQLADTNGDVAGFYRLAIGALVLSVGVLWSWRKGRKRLPAGVIWLCVFAGLAHAADLGMWNTSVLLIGPGIATLLGNTAPLWVALGAWLLFRERLRPLYWVGLGIALAGAALIVGLDALQGLGRGIGNLLGLATGVAYAAYQLLTHRARALIDTMTFMWLYSGVGALALLIVSLGLKHPLVGLPTQTYLALVGMALFSHVGGWMMVNYAFGHLPVSQVTVTLLGQPILTTLLAIVFFGQLPAAWQIAGGIVTLVGIYVVHHSTRTIAPESAPL